MKEVLLDYGDARMTMELPDDGVVVGYGETYRNPPEVNPVGSTPKGPEPAIGFPTAQGSQRVAEEVMLNL